MSQEEQRIVTNLVCALEDTLRICLKLKSQIEETGREPKHDMMSFLLGAIERAQAALEEAKK